VAVIGGDGTLSEAVAGFFALDEQTINPAGQRAPDIGPMPAPINTLAALAILPAGTGDDFARGLTGTRLPTQQWLESLINYCARPEQSLTRQLDVIHGSTDAGANSFICINVVTLGIGAEVARRVAAQRALVRRLPGEARFTAAALGALIAWRERRVRVHVDDRPPLECRSNLLAVANGIYAGGGMMFAPHARPDDGHMDVLLACDLSRATILRELPRIRRGAHLQNPHVRALPCTRVRIETPTGETALPVEADGNVRGRTPAEFQLMPGAIKIISPPQTQR
jgi:diacylglycerol kinase family enzyme